MNTNIFIATPMYGGMCHGIFAMSLLNLAPELFAHGISVAFAPLLNESLITRGRNLLVQRFLDGDCTHLMFIDADIGFRPADIVQMVAADVDVIGGIYPMKGINWNAIKVAALAGKGAESLAIHGTMYTARWLDEHPEPIDGVVEVKHCATGFMLIKRQVFERLAPHVPEYVNDLPDNMSRIERATIREYFATVIDPETRQLLSEDYSFCNLARAHNIKIHAALWPQLLHEGSYIFGHPDSWGFRKP